MGRGEEAEMIRASIPEPSRVFKSDGTCNSLPRARPGAAARHREGSRGNFKGGMTVYRVSVYSEPASLLLFLPFVSSFADILLRLDFFLEKPLLATLSTVLSDFP
ncbi:hypothetical protein KQX54_021737 [Cotesia glomerata]|uniref:Uncharacterized protein n=1 Tax=Cotesia glomerata TaxID=32391 RepID=A0AAV7JA85_COTGL|nr:hypothetical protein KQX54_021737 [Cotesia glomerata]